jgi:hypothetical protein
MKNKLADEVIDEFKNLAKKYNFTVKIDKNGISLCAKNTDRKWEKWIIYNATNNNIVLTGNTDQCNFWFCQTRPDLTPDRLINFTLDLNKILDKIGFEVDLKTLVDPEDWQEIANVRDAYNDPRYIENIEEEEEL